MATSSSVPSKFFIASYRPDVFGDCSIEELRRSAKNNVSLSNAFLGTGRLYRHSHVLSLQNQGGKKGLLRCQALFGRNAPKDENDPEDDSTRSINNDAGIYGTPALSYECYVEVS
ncbi:uncharacterized protein [Physcomitrium patens]|uniref:uncharacterized protein isoform X2 n=1 Tax=Physcomitrium patens TaxID=3218 RepID=UPI003CCE137E